MSILHTDHGSMSNANTNLDPQLDAHHILQYGAGIERKASGSSTASSSDAALRKKKELNRPKAYSSSSRNTNTSTSTPADNRAAQRDVRSLPPWIDSYEEGEELLISKSANQALPSPIRAHAAQHNSSPASTERRISQDGYVDDWEETPQGPNAKKPPMGFFGGHKDTVRGRKWDHAREGEPVIMRAGAPASLWQTFVKSSMYGPTSDEDSKIVDEEFLQQQTPGYQTPWRGDVDGSGDPEKLGGLLHDKKQRRTLLNRVQHILLLHPLVPLVFRLIVLATSTIALGLSTAIHHLSDKYLYAQNPSTTMAIVVDVVAIPYILYVTWDEYTGKPLGLRSAKTKIRLVLLDVFFIIFESANLALAFAALADDNGSCRNALNGFNFVICSRVKALCAILMMALISWSATFSVSIFRLVERVGGREEGD